MGPSNSDLQSLTDLLTKLITPMEETLIQVKASRRFQGFVLTITMLCTLAFSGLVIYSVHEVARMTKAGKEISVRLERMERAQPVYSKKLDNLIQLAQENASSPDIKARLKALQAIKPISTALLSSPSDTDSDTN